MFLRYFFHINAIDPVETTFITYKNMYKNALSYEKNRNTNKNTKTNYKRNN